MRKQSVGLEPRGLQMKAIYASIPLVAALTALGCSPTPQTRYEYSEITGGTAVSRGPGPSLCELVHLVDNVGVFTVAKIHSQMEDLPDIPAPTPVTYVELTTLEMLKGRDREIVIRTPGGKYEELVNGQLVEYTSSWNVAIAVGETIVYFPPWSAFNRQTGHPDMPDVYDVYFLREKGGLYSNGELFPNGIALPALKQMIEQIAAAPKGSCPVDEKPPNWEPIDPGLYPPDAGAGSADAGSDANAPDGG